MAFHFCFPSVRFQYLVISPQLVRILFPLQFERNFLLLLFFRAVKLKCFIVMESISVRGRTYFCPWNCLNFPWRRFNKVLEASPRTFSLRFDMMASHRRYRSVGGTSMMQITRSAASQNARVERERDPVTEGSVSARWTRGRVKESWSKWHSTVSERPDVSHYAPTTSLKLLIQSRTDWCFQAVSTQPPERRSRNWLIRPGNLFPIFCCLILESPCEL